VRETADSTAVVFPIHQMAVRWVIIFERRGRIPRSSGDTRDPVLRSDFALIDGYLGKVAKVTREIAKMGSLFEDGARAERDM